MLQQMNASNPVARVEAVEESVGAQEFLTFTLGEEEYAIDILRVQEIRGYDAVTRIANTPPYIKGVINLRGTIVPIVDLRIKFKLADVTYSEFTVVIILSVGERVIGIVVDSVSDVIMLDSEQIKPAPQFSAAMESDHITGIGTADERMLILIDIERLLLSPKMGLTDTPMQ